MRVEHLLKYDIIGDAMIRELLGKPKVLPHLDIEEW